MSADDPFPCYMVRKDEAGAVTAGVEIDHRATPCRPATC